MCLQKAKQIKQKGEVVCYKVLAKKDSADSTAYYSPFMGQLWEKDKTYTAYSAFSNTGIINDDGAIRSGAFHTFKKRKDVVEYSRSIYWVHPSDLCIARCVIPEDNGYLYKGQVEYYSNITLEGYASEKLKIVDIKPLKRNY